MAQAIHFELVEIEREVQEGRKRTIVENQIVVWLEYENGMTKKVVPRRDRLRHHLLRPPCRRLLRFGLVKLRVEIDEIVEYDDEV